MRIRYAAATVCALFAVGSIAPTAMAHGATQGSTRGAMPASSRAAAATRLSPYLDMGARHPALLREAIRRAHLRAFSAGFVLGRGCTPTWDDGVPVTSDHVVNRVVTSAQRRHVKVVVSFGGSAPTELALSCHNVHRLTAAYRSVIRRFSLTRVDFDIEAGELTDHASIVRRFHAIHALERSDPKLVVSLTLPSAVHGMRPQDDPHVLAIVRRAKAEHVRVGLVNLMTMDYYDGRHHDMGKAAITAAKAGRAQLRGIWPRAGYAQLGITPMIGVNDDSSEVFTLADAKQLSSFAGRHHLGRLAFWSMGRDRGCAAPPPSGARDNCSGVHQRPLAFTRAMLNGRG